MASNEGPPAGYPLGQNNPNFLNVAAATPYRAGAGTLVWTGTQLRINVGTDISPTWKTITYT